MKSIRALALALLIPLVPVVWGALNAGSAPAGTPSAPLPVPLLDALGSARAVAPPPAGVQPAARLDNAGGPIIDERPRWPDDWPSLDAFFPGDATSAMQSMGSGDFNFEVPGSADAANGEGDDDVPYYEPSYPISDEEPDPEAEEEVARGLDQIGEAIREHRGEAGGQDPFREAGTGYVFRSPDGQTLERVVLGQEFHIELRVKPDEAGIPGRAGGLREFEQLDLVLQSVDGKEQTVRVYRQEEPTPEGLVRFTTREPISIGGEWGNIDYPGTIEDLGLDLSATGGSHIVRVKVPKIAEGITSGFSTITAFGDWIQLGITEVGEALDVAEERLRTERGIVERLRADAEAQGLPETVAELEQTLRRIDDQLSMVDIARGHLENEPYPIYKLTIGKTLLDTIVTRGPNGVEIRETSPFVSGTGTWRSVSDILFYTRKRLDEQYRGGPGTIVPQAAMGVVGGYLTGMYSTFAHVTMAAPLIQLITGQDEFGQEASRGWALVELGIGFVALKLPSKVIETIAEGRLVPSIEIRVPTLRRAPTVGEPLPVRPGQVNPTRIRDRGFLPGEAPRVGGAPQAPGAAGGTCPAPRPDRTVETIEGVCVERVTTLPAGKKWGHLGEATVEEAFGRPDLPDDAWVHFGGSGIVEGVAGEGVRGIAGRSFWLRWGEVKGMTQGELRWKIGESATSGTTDLRTMVVAPEASGIRAIKGNYGFEVEGVIDVPVPANRILVAPEPTAGRPPVAEAHPAANVVGAEGQVLGRAAVETAGGELPYPGRTPRRGVDAEYRKYWHEKEYTGDDISPSQEAITPEFTNRYLGHVDETVATARQRGIPDDVIEQALLESRYKPNAKEAAEFVGTRLELEITTRERGRIFTTTADRAELEFGGFATSEQLDNITVIDIPTLETVITKSHLEAAGKPQTWTLEEIEYGRSIARRLEAGEDLSQWKTVDTAEGTGLRPLFGTEDLGAIRSTFVSRPLRIVTETAPRRTTPGNVAPGAAPVAEPPARPRTVDPGAETEAIGRRTQRVDPPERPADTEVMAPSERAAAVERNAPRREARPEPREGEDVFGPVRRAEIPAAEVSGEPAGFLRTTYGESSPAARAYEMAVQELGGENVHGIAGSYAQGRARVKPWPEDIEYLDARRLDKMPEDIPPAILERMPEHNQALHTRLREMGGSQELPSDLDVAVSEGIDMAALEAAGKRIFDETGVLIEFTPGGRPTNLRTAVPEGPGVGQTAPAPAEPRSLATLERYQDLVGRQGAGEAIDLATIARPGIAGVAEGEIIVVQGAGRWERARPGDYLDVFLPADAQVPAGVEHRILATNVPAEVVRQSNLLSSRGAAGANPTVVDAAVREVPLWNRVQVRAERVAAPTSRVAGELESEIARLADEGVDVEALTSAVSHLPPAERLAVITDPARRAEALGAAAGRASEAPTPATQVLDPAAEPQTLGGPSGRGGGESEVEMLIRTLGGSTGRVVEAFVANHGDEPVRIQGSGVVLEPVELDDQARLRAGEILDAASSGKPLPPPQEDDDRTVLWAPPWAEGPSMPPMPASWRGAAVVRVVLDGYCLELGADVPAEGVVFRIADSEAQAANERVRRILESSRELRDRGALHPDGEPAAYFHSVRQWAIWVDENQFDREVFEVAFIEHVKRVFEAADREWTTEAEELLKEFIPNRWSDVVAVLQSAGVEVPETVAAGR